MQKNTVEEILVLTDKLSQVVFNPKHSNKKEIHLLECKKPVIATTVKVEALKGELNQFDKAVFLAAVSIQTSSNEFTTIRELFQLLGGGHVLTANMKQAILESIEKLACTRLTITTPVSLLKKFDYSAGKNFNLKRNRVEYEIADYLLPCRTVAEKINGQVVDGAIKFLATSPLVSVAKMKNQIQLRDPNLLQPDIRTSTLTIKLTSYLFERISLIKGSRKQKNKRVNKLQKIITFEKIFYHCGLADATKRQQQQARDNIEKILNFFVEQGFIKQWNFQKKNKAFYSIHFD